MSTTLVDEAFRLVDPFTCLVCGAQAASGRHLCGDCPPEAWGDRFIREPAPGERLEAIAKMADWMGLTIQGAENEVETIGYTWGDYTEHATAFFKALDKLTVWGLAGAAHPSDCEDCSGANIPASSAPAVHHAMFLLDIKCPLFEVHIRLINLACFEDLRHGLDVGVTFAEIERVARDRRIAERLAKIADRRLDDIVTGVLDGEGD